MQDEFFDNDDVPPLSPDVEEVLGDQVSHYIHDADILATPNEHLIIPDDTCDELGLRALADILSGNASPGQHGGTATVEAKVVRSGRIVFTRKAFWAYDELLHEWIELPQSLIQNRIAAYRQTQYGRHLKVIEGPDGSERKIYKRLRMTAAKISSAEKVAQSCVARDRFFDEAPRGLLFTDAFLQYQEGGGWNVHEPSPRLRQRAGYPFSCPPDTFLQSPVTDDRWRQVCPTLYQVLESSLKDRLEDWRALRQRFGLALAGFSQRVRGAHLWFLGPPGTGKSSVATAFGTLFPKGSRTAVNIHDAPEYRTGALERSRVNVCGECLEVKTPAFFKDCLTGGMVEVRDTQKSALVITPGFLSIMCSNGRPGMTKDAKSIVDRFTILRFQEFSGKPIRDLLQRMEREARGIVEWSLAGLVDFEQHGLVESSESALLKESWWRSSDNVLLWAAEHLRAHPGGVIPVDMPATKDGAFQHYLKWAEEKNIAPRLRKDYSEFRDSLRELKIEVRKAGKHHKVSIIDYRMAGPEE